MFAYLSYETNEVSYLYPTSRPNMPNTMPIVNHGAAAFVKSGHHLKRKSPRTKAIGK